jgi:methylmalonyl-CoA/ethylmalonyl-CoA epimerase
MSAEFGLDRIGQIAVNAKDIARATEFYRDRLGIRFLFAAPHMAFFQCGEQWLMLSEPAEPEFDHPSSTLYFDVADIEQAHATLAGRGVEFRSAPHVVHRAESYDLWLADFRDSEGNTLALRSMRPKS